MINTKLSVAIHILSLIASEREKQLSSEFIAASVNTNPVVIRRLTGMLTRAGILSTRTGISGSVLVKDPSRITLLDIYRAVSQREELFAIHDNPNIKCQVGRQIQSALDDVFGKVQKEMESSLRMTTLADVMKVITKKNRSA